MAYNLYRDGAHGSLAIHVDDALKAGNALFYDLVILPFLSKFSISMSLSQDTKSIKDLPTDVDSFTEEKKPSVFKSLISQLLYLDLTLTQICSTYHRQNEPTFTRQC